MQHIYLLSWKSKYVLPSTQLKLDLTNLFYRIFSLKENEDMFGEDSSAIISSMPL